MYWGEASEGEKEVGKTKWSIVEMSWAAGRGVVVWNPCIRGVVRVGGGRLVLGLGVRVEKSWEVRRSISCWFVSFLFFFCLLP